MRRTVTTSSIMSIVLLTHPDGSHAVAIARPTSLEAAKLLYKNTFKDCLEPEDIVADSAKGRRSTSKISLQLATLDRVVIGDEAAWKALVKDETRLTIFRKAKADSTLAHSCQEGVHGLHLPLSIQRQ